MSIELQLLAWWILFGGTHILGSSSPVRSRLIGALGLPGFKALYSLVALATFVPLVRTYWLNRHEGAVLFQPPSWAQHLTEALMLVAVVTLLLGFVTPQPATTAAELSRRLSASPRGIHRITRHPMNTAFALFGLAHMLSNPTAGDWIFWGGFPVYAWLSAMHQDRRALASGASEFRTFHATSSLVPFGAVLTGRQKVVLGEINFGVLVLGVALFAAIRWLHPLWIGGFG